MNRHKLYDNGYFKDEEPEGDDPRIFFIAIFIFAIILYGFWKILSSVQ